MELTVTEICRKNGWDLKPHANGGKGRELCGPCPKCGGKDRFVVFEEQNNGLGTWYCRQCEHEGDGIELLRWVTGCSFKEAAYEVGRELTREGRHFTRRSDEGRYPKWESNVKTVKEIPAAPKSKTATGSNTGSGTASPSPAAKTASGTGTTGSTAATNRKDTDTTRLLVEDIEKWRGKAAALVEYCNAALLNDESQMEYLARRGINEAAVRKYKLGWLEGEKDKPCIIRPRPVWGLARDYKQDGTVKHALWIPRGIVIPAFNEAGDVVRLRIRRTKGDREQSLPNLKYYVVPGSDMRPMWLPVIGKSPINFNMAMVVEAELDAIAVHSVAGEFIGVLGAMTAACANLPSDIFEDLKKQDRLLIATDVGDASKAGDTAWERWHHTFGKAVRYGADGGKDPGEMAENGKDILEWVLNAYPSEAYKVGAVKAYAERKRDAVRAETAAVCREAREREKAAKASGAADTPAVVTSDASENATDGGAVANTAASSQNQTAKQTPTGVTPPLTYCAARERQKRQNMKANEECRATICELLPLETTHVGDPYLFLEILEYNRIFMKPTVDGGIEPVMTGCGGDDYTKRAAMRFIQRNAYACEKAVPIVLEKFKRMNEGRLPGSTPAEVIRAINASGTGTTDDGANTGEASTGTAANTGANTGTDGENQ